MNPSAAVRPSVHTLDEIRQRIEVPRLIREIEKGFVLYSQGRVDVPPVGFLHFEQPPGDVHIKYGAVAGGDHYVLKVASAFYANPERGLPAGDGLMLVFSQATGQVQSVLLDGGWLTDLRTAAAGAVAAKHLAPTVVETIGIVGTGVQARLQLEHLRHVVDCRHCLIWGRDTTKADAMIADLRARESMIEWGIRLERADSIQGLAERCRLIVTTTPARTPILLSDQIRPGTHITAMGSDDHGKQELEAALLARADVVVADSRSQCIDHGECAAAIQERLIDESRIVELGEVVQRPELGRRNDGQITIADLTGVAIQDIVIAGMAARDDGSNY